MYEIIQACGNSYYIDCPAKIGIVKVSEDEVILIDSGNNKEAGKKAKRHIEANGWVLKAIYNTHSHADHIGGNKYLQSQTGCKIYAPKIEDAFTAHTVLEPAFLYGGDPCSALRHKFLMAEESDVLPLTEDVLPEGFEIIPLPGHCFNMAGFRTADDVVYLADAFSSRETIDKYAIGFIYNVGDYLKTLEGLKELKAKCFIPSHAPVGDNITDLVDYNIAKVMEIAQKIENICTTPTPFEQLLKRLFDEYGLTLTIEQYVLVGSTVRSYLSWLYDEGKIETQIIDNTLLWKTK